ncbi:MAG: hypothetical protein WCS84_12595 [Nocardioides sp.]
MRRSLPLLIAVLLALALPADAGPVWNPDAFSAKLDNLATSGLTGTANSLSYRVHELERHFHGRERWYGKLAVQTATDWADNNLTPFVCISGANDYGTDANDEALVIGTADTPTIAGMAQYDLHRLFIVDSSVDELWKIQLIYGAGTMAAAIAAGQYSTIMFFSDVVANQNPHGPVEVMMPRAAVGSVQVWARCWSGTDNATLEFFAGWHEYEG